MNAAFKMPCPIDLLSLEECIYLLKRLDIQTASRLSCTCKRLYLVSQQLHLYRHHARVRFGIDLPYHDIRMKHEAFETWKTFYERLDQARTGWRGYCIDPLTNNFEPYPMELVLQSCQKIQLYGLMAEAVGLECTSVGNLGRLSVGEIKGFCRWKTLNDSLTLVLGNLLDIYNPFPTRFIVNSVTNRQLIRHIVFKEIEIVRGEDIAIPNNYYGLLDGYVAIGMYNPGDENNCGVFCIVMEESISIPPPRITFTNNNRYTGIYYIAVDSTEGRQCRLIVNQTQDLGNFMKIIGTFYIDKTMCSTTCREPEKYNGVYSARFEAYQYLHPEDTEMVLENATLMCDGCSFIPDQQFKIYQKGKLRDLEQRNVQHQLDHSRRHRHEINSELKKINTFINDLFAENDRIKQVLEYFLERVIQTNLEMEANKEAL
ncbi:hypothetical protein HDV04_005010 [Boothiomyces sp. JEL0838]|nr:hypothetical protein HDV04_005010 [Boothiomyces sp. JEL0838]